MAQDHLDRLSSVDAGFLHAEDGGNAHMHIGGLAILEGPAPSVEDFQQHIATRLQLVPRYRQRLVNAPLHTGRPLWVDDPDFTLSYHVRHTALPAPGTEEQLRVLAGRVVSQRLDRTKPLWEIWLVEGLADGRWAVINKTHHALVDGVGGMDILTALFDLTPEPRELPVDTWEPQPAPNSIGLLAHGARGAVGRATGLATGIVRGITNPTGAVGKVVEAAQGLGEVAQALLDPAPATPLNLKPGPHRRFTTVSTKLADYKTVKNSVGGTVNDVVLAVVAGAVAEFLRGRGVETEGLRLRACVPVSVRTSEQKGGAGNKITIMVAPLPVDVDDPLQRLAAVREEMDDLKESKQAIGAELLTKMEDFLPPTILAQAARLSFSPRLYNFLVTNVPGPQFPVYMLGSRMQEIFPIAFLAPSHLLAIAIVSYDGQVNLGLLGDYDGLPDLDVLAKSIEHALAELVEQAEAVAKT